MDEISKIAALDYPKIIQGIELFGLFFIFLILCELLYDYFINKEKRDFKQALVDLGIYIGHELIGRFVALIIFFAILNVLGQYSLTKIPVNLYSWAGLLILTDFVYYWSHRLEHRSRFFWSWHSVHHSSHDFSGTTAIRLAWLEPLVSWYVLAPLVLIGFDVVQTLLMFQILLTYQTWIHTKKIPYLGSFELIFNSPSSHRVHHGSNTIYLDKNYGALFIIWDRIFGTYQRETEAVVYGLTEPVASNNPFILNLKEPLNLIRGISKQKTIIGKIKWALSSPDSDK